MRVGLYSFIILLNSLSQGILVPVFSLMLIEKGATLSELSILIGIYSFTVIVLELPTGIMADLIGRKKTFCLSLLVAMVFSVIFLFSRSMVTLVIGMLFYGINRAISSGSFEALFIDSYIDEYGKDRLHEVSTRINVCDALGLSAGSLLGGYLPKLSEFHFSSLGTYDLSLIVRFLVTLVCLTLALTFIKETIGKESRKQVTLAGHVKSSAALVVGNKSILAIFISVFATGFLFSSIETFWQPHFIDLMPDDSYLFLLGVMAFIYFAAAMAGSILYSRIFSKRNTKRMYLLLRCSLAAILILAASQTNMFTFMVFYSLIYLFFGLATIPESVLLNNEIPNEVRASILSLNSLIIQMGALFGSFLNSVIIHRSTIPSLWYIAAAVMLITVLIVYLMNRNKGQEELQTES